MNTLTPVENAILSIAFHSQNQKASVGDLMGGLEILSGWEYDKYALLNILKDMHKKQLITLRGITAALNKNILALHEISTLDQDTLEALKALPPPNKEPEPSTPTLTPNPTITPAAIPNTTHLTNTEVNIITILQARNQHTSMNQIIKDLYKLTGRLYGRDSLVERLNSMSIKGILIKEGTKIKLVDGIPLYREEDYKRLQQK